MRLGWTPEKESRLESRAFTAIISIIIVVLILSISYLTRTGSMNSTTTTTTTMHPVYHEQKEVENGDR
jgi:uncharacterized protein YpmB